MHAAQVLDMQADLHRRLGDDEFLDAISAALAGDAGLDEGDPRGLPLGRNVLRHLREHVKHGDAYRVTPDMAVLTEYAASRLDESDRWRRDMAPTEWGVVRFESPMHFADVRGVKMLAHWMTWGPVTVDQVSPITGESVRKRATLLTWWNDPATDVDDVLVPREIAAAMRRIMGRWLWVGSGLVVEGASLGPAAFTMSPEQAAKMIEREGVIPHAYTNAARLAWALFMLMNQTITSTTEERIPRAAQKRVGRMPTPRRVSVVTLRRIAGRKSEGESQVEWAHRWMVRGHPAWRKCSPDKPGAEPYEKGWRVRVWIHPYMKLADRKDLPLVQTTKVYQLSR